MNTISYDLVVVGGGPAGLAAAVEAKNQGVRKILVIERDRELGGILQQCIHDGFGLHRFKQRLSGSQYAQRFIDMVDGLDIDVKINTMVLEITPNKDIYACSSEEGMMHIAAKSIILAMGCRERTCSQAFIYGARPAGVLTAGAVQRYINMEGYLPGKEAVILGSGDIGLIMARRMTLEGIKVKGVYELMASPGGLTRNIVQCLDDYGIPLHIATTVTEVHGKERITGVTVAKVDENRKPIPGTQEEISCDLLVLAVGLIPENELSHGLGLEMDAKTNGPVVDTRFMTSQPGIFAAGNVSAVFDLVDYVSKSGEIAARGAAAYLHGDLPEDEVYTAVAPGENVNFIIPQRIAQSDTQEVKSFFLRVKQPDKNVTLTAKDGAEQVVHTKKHRVVAPPEMLACEITAPELSGLTISVGGAKI